VFFWSKTVAKDNERDGDLRRLLRRVTNRSKSSSVPRRQRSKSAHAHLQSNGRGHDDGVVAKDATAASEATAAAAAQKLKLSNDELHTTASARSPDLERLKGRERGRGRKPTSTTSGTPTSGQQSDSRPTMRSELVGLVDSSSLERGRAKASRPVATLPSHRTATSTSPMLMMIMPLRSYCGVVGGGSRTESVLLSPAHSRDILLRQSRHRVAAANSGAPAGRSTALADDNGDAVDSGGALNGSAASYLGSSATDGVHSAAAMMRRNRRTAQTLRCWQRPQSSEFTAAERLQSGVADRDSRLTVNGGDETGDVGSSADDCPPPTGRVPLASAFLEFKRAYGSQEMSPLSLSVQCGSDTDELEAAHETYAVPKHRLMSKRVWNANTCRWDDHDDLDRHCSTDSVCSNREDGRCSSPGAVVFAKAAVAAGFAAASGESRSLLQLYAKRRCNRSSFSENDLQPAAQRSNGWTDHDSAAAAVTRHPPVAKNIDDDDGAADPPTARHSVTGAGSSYDDRLLSSWRRQIVQSFCRAKSCPEMTGGVPGVLDSDAAYRWRRRMSRVVNGAGGRSAPKSCDRRRCRRPKRTFRRQKLAPPLNASWPGRGDVKGSILTYESSV